MLAAVFSPEGPGPRLGPAIPFPIVGSCGAAMSDTAHACRDYALGYLLAIALIAVLAWLISSAGLDTGGTMSAVPLITATFFTGARFAQRNGHPPAAGLAWRVGLWGAAISLAISLLALGVAVLLLGDAARAEVLLAAERPGTMAIIVAVLLAFHVLMIRFLMPFAARVSLRSAERRRGRR